MICVFAGNRVDGPDADVVRFPEANVGWVRRRIEQLVLGLKPSAMVGAGAAGADLLVHDVASSLRIPAHLVLPFPAARFRATSVADRGAAWTSRFDRVHEATPPERRHVADRTGDDDEVFLVGNGDLLDVAHRVAAGQEILALAIRTEPGAGRSSVTDDFVDRAGARGLTVIDLDPSLTRPQMRTAFVVMPYGVKPDRGGRMIDCDATFGKLIVPALEDADLNWFRADKEVDAGIIHVGMIDRLATSSVVVVDTATENPNVFYELGLRHLLAERCTVLIGPEGSRLPFNVSMLRRVGYRLAGTVISDSEALAGVRELTRHLAAAVEPAGPRAVDSPIYQLFEVVPPSLRPRSAVDDALLALHRRVDEAAELDAGELSQLVRDVEEADLPAAQRRVLVLRVAVALRATKRYHEAFELLTRTPVTPQEPLLYGFWAQQLAMARRRLGEEALGRGEEPEPWWRPAESLLQDAMDRLGDDPETCGIAAGLAKRRALRFLTADGAPTAQRTKALGQLRRAFELYVRGFRVRPSDYYTGVNVVTVGGLLARAHQPVPGPDLGVIAAVTDYYVHETAAPDFWNLVTRAELALNAHLAARDDDRARARAVDDYALALAGAHPSDYDASVRDQLDLIRLVEGDPSGAATEILGLLTPARGAPMTSALR